MDDFVSMSNIEFVTRVDNAINGRTYGQGGLNLNHIKKVLASYGVRGVGGPRHNAEAALKALLPEIKEAEDTMAEQLTLISDEY